MTITTPKGHKVRCTSHRRFFVIADRPDSATVELRTDNLETARTLVRRKGNFFGSNGAFVVRSIFDSRRKEVVR